VSKLLSMMKTTDLIPANIKDLFSAELAAKEKLNQSMSALVKEMDVDRCFLYLRNPVKKKGRIAFCACRNSSIPDATEQEWKKDTGELPEHDPLFAAALNLQPAIFIDDVLTAAPAVLNKSFEAKTFGHRSLIHAHIVHNNRLWGILQPAMFGAPRQWSQQDKDFILAVVALITPLVVEFMQDKGIVD
jgi:GAF domain-containing protein